MKYLSISLTLILTLLTNHSAFAELNQTTAKPTPAIDQVVVIAEPEVADFEIFSLKHGEQAINEITKIFLTSLGNEQPVNTDTSIKPTPSS